MVAELVGKRVVLTRQEVLVLTKQVDFFAKSLDTNHLILKLTFELVLSIQNEISLVLQRLEFDLHTNVLFRLVTHLLSFLLHMPELAFILPSIRLKLIDSSLQASQSSLVVAIELFLGSNPLLNFFLGSFKGGGKLKSFVLVLRNFISQLLDLSLIFVDYFENSDLQVLFERDIVSTSILQIDVVFFQNNQISNGLEFPLVRLEMIFELWPFLDENSILFPEFLEFL